MPELPSSLRVLHVYVRNDRTGLTNQINDHGLPPCGDDNRPPEVIRGIQDHSFPRPAIPDQNSPEAWASRNNLDNNFRDPDGDDLSFTATSSNPAKATVSVRGSTLTVSAVAEGGAGTATITVTASDGKDDGTASFSFTVTVNVRRVELQISKKTIQISDPINEIPFDTIVRKIADVSSGKIFQRAAKRVPVTEEQKLLDAAERGVEAVQYEISKPSLLAQVPQLLNSGSPLWQTLQNELSRILSTYFDSYTVNLTAKPQSSVTVRISSNHPDAFDISPETLTFTPDNWSQPQRVQVRLAFTIQNYINGEIPNLATLSHTASSGANADVQIGVTELRPIREHVYDALISFAPEIAPLVVQGLCGLNPVCGSFLLGRSIGNLITELIEDTVLDEALDTVLEPIFEKILAVEDGVDVALDAYNQGGMGGLVDHLSDKLSSSDADPAPAASRQPRVAIQGRLQARSAPAPAAAGGGDDVSFLDQTLQRSALFLLSRQQDLNAGRFHLSDALAALGTDFNLPLSSLTNAQHPSPANKPNPNPRNLALWGSLDYSQFGDIDDNFSTDGNNWTFTGGVDGYLNPKLLAGLALSHSTTRSDFDYFDDAMDGDYNVDITVLSPYLNWDANDRLGLWASLGYGKGSSQFSLNTIGELKMASIDALDQDATRQKQDSDFFSFAGGLRWDALRSPHSRLALKLAGSSSSFLETDNQQGRLAAQVSRDFQSPNGILSSSLDLALLLDSDTPSVMEVVAGLDWAAHNDKFTASTVARSLLFSGDRYQWGLGAALNYQAGVRPGEGLSLSLQPSFGVTHSPNLAHMDILSTPEDRNLTFQPSQPTARLNARLAYGINNGHALLTPYTQLDMTHHTTTTTAGLLYQLDHSLDLDLNASRQQRSSGNHDNRLFLQLRSDL